MKWHLYLIVITAVACRANITVTEDEIGADVFYAHDSFKPYSGKCTVLFKNTPNIKEQFTFRDGLLHGESLAWYRNGQLRRKGYYHKGQISGKWEFWDEQGNKIIEAHYRADILEGSFVSLYANGKVKEKGQFSKNRRTGKWAYYNEQGKMVRSIME